MSKYFNPAAKLFSITYARLTATSLNICTEVLEMLGVNYSISTSLAQKPDQKSPDFTYTVSTLLNIYQAKSLIQTMDALNLPNGSLHACVVSGDTEDQIRELVEAALTTPMEN